MKKQFPHLFLVLFVVALFSTASIAQTSSCSDLINALQKKAGYGETVNATGSSAISKAVRYTYDGQGYVIVYFSGYNSTPYVFCDISSTRWSSFKSAGNAGSWGKAFNDYIKGRDCNCR